MIDITIDSSVSKLSSGIVTAQSTAIGPSNEQLLADRERLIRQVREQQMAGGEPRREAVRQMIRAGGFKPSGRNKPAQEYLLRTVTEAGELPSIFNVVDWINVISLASGLPISLLSVSSLGEKVSIRYGRQGESFVFNRSGQELGLDGLICICSGALSESIPLGTPIKDSMAGKVTETNRDIVAFLYAPQGSVRPDEIRHWCDELARGFKDFCGAAGVEVLVKE